MDFEFDLNNPDLPPRPPQLPRPKPWRTAFAVVWDLLFATYLYNQPYRIPIFASGLMTALAVYQLAEYVKLLRQVKRLQTEMDQTYDAMVERLTMLPKLVERHGPNEAIQIMSTADALVSEGDFPTVRDAVAAIERHHDMEPTVYDD
jgi:hypothetical protein